MKTNNLIEPYSENISESEYILEKFKDLKIVSAYGSKWEKLRDFEKDESIDILRSYSTSDCDSKLIRDGYILKPSWILWLLENNKYNSDDDYLNSLRKKDRYEIKKSLKFLQDSHAYKITIEDSISERNLKNFYELYKGNIKSIKNGVDLLKEDYNEFLKRRTDFKGIYIYCENSIIGGILCIKRERMLRAIYLAVDKNNTQPFDVTRLLYFTLIREGISQNYELTSLGADPSLYGHMVSIGLFHIKKKMGFRPYPAKYMGEESLDLYEKLINVDKFNGIALSLAYENNDCNSNNLDCYVYSNYEIPDKERKKIMSEFFTNIIYKERCYEKSSNT
ncbi:MULTISPECIES: peptidogalycan biosysnthesis protein [Cytobacillus]|uniref:Uncharacterized protein n=2 Tax=Cytobacillus firmus TaxID=1399 RepID=W7KLS0_CYTFI|nr:peptidogalycan biosysnthesis protein [Cytobacillus firmus]EWG08350.1 hypothetical protein PBF_24693 [Cytobacillus firmus DS1]